ncbi:tail fiber domain-containing protein [Microbacterium sp.]|uniref:tail fiber domain-containing protein n=1 Tax=Actinomycetes TaxID=1760 RepID=UPI0037C61CBA
MAIGDDAASAGMDLVSGATAANTLDTEINKSRDYIAQRTNEIQPVAKGGTGATDAAGALANLGAVAAADVYDGGSVANKIAKYDGSGRLICATPAAANQAAPKVYVDQRVSKSGDTISGNLVIVDGHLYVPDSVLASSGYTVAYINGDGRLARGASSRRYKKNIKAAPRDAFGRVLDLRPVTFQWRNNIDVSEHTEFGLIAEDVAEILPWMVVPDKEGRPDSVLYERLALALLPIVRDLSERVAQLEAERDS